MRFHVYWRTSLRKEIDQIRVSTTQRTSEQIVPSFISCLSCFISGICISPCVGFYVTTRLGRHWSLTTMLTSFSSGHMSSLGARERQEVWLPVHMYSKQSWKYTTTLIFDNGTDVLQIGTYAHLRRQGKARGFTFGAYVLQAILKIHNNTGFWRQYWRPSDRDTCPSQAPGKDKRFDFRCICTPSNPENTQQHWSFRTVLTSFSWDTCPA